MRNQLVCLALAGLVFTGCSTRYEITLKRPNPYDTHRLTAASKPRTKTVSMCHFQDVYGRAMQIESKYVKKIAPPPEFLVDSNQPRLSAPWDIHLVEDNPYNTTFLRSLTEPETIHRKTLTFEDLDGRELELEERYITRIQPAKKPDDEEDFGVRSKPDAQFRGKFDFR